MKNRLLNLVSVCLLVLLTACPNKSDDPVLETTNFFKMELDGNNFENAQGAGGIAINKGFLFFAVALKSSNNAVFTFACKENTSGTPYSFNGLGKDSTAFGVNFATSTTSLHANYYETCDEVKSTDGSLQFQVSGSGSSALATGSFSGELAIKDGKQTCKNGFEIDKYRLVKVSGSFKLPYSKIP